MRKLADIVTPLSIAGLISKYKTSLALCALMLTPEILFPASWPQMPEFGGLGGIAIMFSKASATLLQLDYIPISHCDTSKVPLWLNIFLIGFPEHYIACKMTSSTAKNPKTFHISKWRYPTITVASFQSIEFLSWLCIQSWEHTEAWVYVWMIVYMFR